MNVAREIFGINTDDLKDESLPIYSGEEARRILAEHEPIKWKFSASIDETWGRSLSVKYETQRKREAAKREKLRRAAEKEAREADKNG